MQQTLAIDERRWQRTLERELPRIAHDLGVPEGATLRAELHNLLVDGPGQFFAPHQDSEKSDGMIGSLVVLLPSDAKGGALVIEHHDERVSYRGSNFSPRGNAIASLAGRTSDRRRALLHPACMDDHLRDGPWPCPSG